MTREQLWRRTVAVIAVYGVAFLGGFALRIRDATPGAELYSTYHDMIPLVIAMPAAYLAFCFQQRIAYASRLRVLWTALVRGFQKAVSYTYIESATRTEHLSVLEELRIVIEEMRAEYRNVPVSSNPKGWYPFEPFKQIHDEIERLGFGNASDPLKREIVRTSISKKWKEMRPAFLEELDPVVPTYHHAWYASDRSARDD